MARGFNYAPGASAEVEEASRDGLGKERLTELGGSRNPVVREAVAARPDCPLGMMVTLAHDHAAPVRAAIAGNPRVLRSVLEYLARDRQVDVLVAVAGNPGTPAEVLDALAGHRKREVSNAAVAALDARAVRVEGEQQRMPELRDRVFEESEARRAALADGEPAAVPDEPAPAPAAELPVRPTRTAPVRGFRPPVDV